MKSETYQKLSKNQKEVTKGDEIEWNGSKKSTK